MKQTYQVPTVLKSVAMELETDLLVGSVVTQSTTIETAGQQVETHTFSAEGFNSTWE